MTHNEKRMIEELQEKTKLAVYVNMIHTEMTKCENYESLSAKIRLKINILVRHFNGLDSKYAA